MTPLITFVTTLEAHEARFLPVLHNLMMNQTDPAWQWMIVFRDAMPESLPANLAYDIDERINVRVMPGVTTARSKATVVAESLGQFFAIVEAHDRIASNAVETVRKYANKPGVYSSDFIVRRENGRCDVYAGTSGWEHYFAKFEGEDSTIMRPFPVSARSLIDLGVSPFRLVVWSRDVYDAVNGYDPGMMYADDYDLILRAYLHESRPQFYYLPACLYERRADLYLGTTIEKHKAEEANELRNQLTANIIDTWADREDLRKYSVHSPTEGYSHESLKTWSHADMGRVGVIQATDALGYLPAGGLVEWMQQAYRWLAPGGWLRIVNVSASGYGMGFHPEHTTHFTEHTLRHFTEKIWSDKLQSNHETRFQIVRLSTYYPTPWYNERKIAYLAADLCALKGQRQPGESLI